MSSYEIHIDFKIYIDVTNIIIKSIFICQTQKMNDEFFSISWKNNVQFAEIFDILCHSSYQKQ